MGSDDTKDDNTAEVKPEPEKPKGIMGIFGLFGALKKVEPTEQHKDQLEKDNTSGHTTLRSEGPQDVVNPVLNPKSKITLSPIKLNMPVKSDNQPLKLGN